MHEIDKKIEDITKDYNTKQSRKLLITLFVCFAVVIVVLTFLIIYAFTFR